MTMTYEDFKGELLHRRWDFLPKQMQFASLTIEPVSKWNDSYEALMLRTPENTVGTSFNLNSMYEASKVVGMDEIVDRLRDLISSLEYDKIREITESEDFLRNYSDIKDNLFLRCGNVGRNPSFLENCPHREQNGLVVTVHAGLDWKPDTVPDYSTVITNDFLKSWNISEETLFADAQKNAQIRMPVVLKRLSDLMQQISSGQMMPPSPDEPDIFVLTNSYSYYGAASAFYPEMLDAVHEMLGNYYMLPSSVHEWLLLPEALGMDVGALEHMVREVNRFEVRPEDFLSDDVYHFDGEKMELARDYEKRMYKAPEFRAELPENGLDVSEDRPLAM